MINPQEFYDGFDEAFHKSIEELSAKHNLSPSQFTQRIFLRWLAEQGAIDRIHGEDSPRFYLEFEPDKSPADLLEGLINYFVSSMGGENTEKTP